MTLENQQIRLNRASGESTTEKRFSPLLRQTLGCSSPLLCTVAVGNVFGYSTILLPQLREEDSEIKLNPSEESWIASIASISMALACVLAGMIMEKYGRKPLFVLTNGLFVIGWMILCFSVNIYGLLVGRFVTGFCVGLLSPSISVYIGEITQPTYRGIFMSMQGFGASFGLLVPHALGIFFSWNVVAFICAVIPLTCYFLIVMVPESPSWLLDDGQKEKAAKSFTWFRGYGSESMIEFKQLVEGQKVSKDQRNSMGFRNIVTTIQTKSFYKPFSFLLLYFATLQFAGSNVIAFYTITILKKSLGEHINEYAATMVVDFSRVIASVLSCFVIKNVGRRPLTVFSGLTTAATLFGLTAYLYCASANGQLKSFYGIPLTLFTLYVMCIMIGLNPLAWILTGELFPLRCRALGSGLVTFFNFTFLFISVKTTPGLFVVLGEYGVFCMFGICCLAGTLLLAVFHPETRNRTLQEIEESYEKPVEHLETIKI